GRAWSTSKPASLATKMLNGQSRSPEILRKSVHCFDWTDASACWHCKHTPFGWLIDANVRWTICGSADVKFELTAFVRRATRALQNTKQCEVWRCSMRQT